jgi:hypothetical protein
MFFFAGKNFGHVRGAADRVRALPAGGGALSEHLLHIRLISNRQRAPPKIMAVAIKLH